MSEFGGLWKDEKTLLPPAFLVKSDPNFPWEKFPLGQQSVQNTKKKKKKDGEAVLGSVYTASYSRSKGVYLRHPSYFGRLMICMFNDNYLWPFRF